MQLINIKGTSMKARQSLQLIFLPGLILLGLTIAFAALVVTTQQTEAASTQLAYWQLDETSGTTFSNTANPGTLDATCSNCPTPATAQINGGQTFNGTTNAVNIAADAALGFTAVDSFTAELWLQADSGCVSDAVAIGRGDATSGPYWSLGCDPTAGQARFTLSDGTNTVVVTSTRVISPSTWHHLTATWDGPNDTATLYFDRTDVVSATAVALTGNLAPTTADLNIGHLNNTQHFSGILDEVALYNTVLPTNEIGEHYYFPQAYGSTCTNPVAVMPLGDSITVGVYGSKYIDPDTLLEGDPRADADIPGYRQPLYLSLRDNNHNIDFVGGQQHGANVVPQFDIDHEGISGQTDSQVANKVYNLMVSYPTDVVLLHIGTNAPDTNTADVEKILNEIDRYETDYGRSVTVVLALIINRINPYSPTFTTFNVNIEAMANTRIANGDKIIIVDMENDAGIVYSLFSSGGDFSDRLHLYDNGNAKMANTWLNTLNTFLPNCNVTPVISSLPVTGVQANTPYTYQMTASGSPTINFQLDTPPSGMTIDSGTGLINWTPTLTGTYPITATAVNPYGSDTQYFTITVTDTVTAVAPTITTTPGTTATVGTPYSYDVDASGDAPITYSLSVTPTGMTIDSATGIISWTPTTPGDANVTVVATNNTGSDSQSFTITVSAVPGNLQLSCPVPTELVAYYPLNDSSGSTFVDLSGSNNDTTCTSSNCPTPAAGLISGSQTFTDGDATRVDAANPTNFDFADTDNFSFSLWVNTTQSCTGNKVFMARRNAQFWLGCNDAGNVNLALNSDLQSSSTNITGGSVINDGNWHHLAATLETGTPNDTVRVYVDGVEVAAETTVDFDSFTHATEPLTLGYYNTGSRYYFDGRLDDVAIFRRALTPAEIQAIYNNGNGAGVGLPYDTAWTGSSSNAWETAANWTNGVPASTNNVAIPTGMAQLNANATVACIDIASGATVDLGTNTFTVEDTMTNNGTLIQTKTAVSGSSPIPFLNITNSGATTTQYLGVDLTPNSNLGNVTVSVREIDSAAGEYCTTTGAASPTYADRCYTITPQTQPTGTSTVRLYARSTDELNAIPGTDLTIYHNTGGSTWTELTNRIFGIDGDYAYAQGDTTAFSPFILGQTGVSQAPTAVSLATLSATSGVSSAIPVLLTLLTALTLIGFSVQRKR